jgi:hypothetical protein
MKPYVNKTNTVVTDHRNFSYIIFGMIGGIKSVHTITENGDQLLIEIVK